MELVSCHPSSRILRCILGFLKSFALLVYTHFNFGTTHVKLKRKSRQEIITKDVK
jgi:hypothetical protein